MIFKKFLPVLAIGAVAVAAVFGAISYRNVSAAAPTAQNVQASQPISFDMNMGRGPGGQGGASDQELATALGIDTTKLQAAYQTATTEALKQAVAAGLITQAQADQMLANDNGRFHGLPMVNSSSIDYNALLAKALGITTDQLKAAYQTAFTARIDQAVKDGNLTQAQADLQKGRYALENSSKFQSSLQSAYEAAVKQAVTDGVITQAQADAILKEQANKGQMGFGGPAMGGRGGFEGPGGRGGRGNGHLPGNQNNPQTPNQNATPTPNSGL